MLTEPLSGTLSVDSAPLDAHTPDGWRRRSDEDDVFTSTQLSKLCVLGQEPIAGMNRLHTAVQSYYTRTCLQQNSNDNKMCHPNENSIITVIIPLNIKEAQRSSVNSATFRRFRFICSRHNYAWLNLKRKSYKPLYLYNIQFN